MEPERIAITIRIPPALHRQVKSVAGLASVNALITEAIEQAVNPAPSPNRASEAAGFEPTPISKELSPLQRNRIASWVSLTLPVLGPFRLHLEGVDHTEERNSFVGARMEKRFVLSAAITALGTWLRGGLGAGKDAKSQINALKKKADAVSAYILSEALFFSTRGLPENHALMVCLGEGAMPKSGETPEQGANPQIAFGRVFARPDVAVTLTREIRPLLNQDSPVSHWKALWQAIRRENLTVWGSVIDTLECTSRFSGGEPTGPMVVFHVFDQPLTFASPYESYMGTLTLPAEVVRTAVRDSIAIHYRTPRAKIVAAINRTYGSIRPENIHVWTLGGSKRGGRLAAIWNQWKELGVHLINEDGWRFPGMPHAIFTDSGTYAPVYRVGIFEVDGEHHIFLTDGYASSAEAVQAASLDRARQQRTFLCLFPPDTMFESTETGYEIMRLDPEPSSEGDLTPLLEKLRKILDRPLSPNDAREYNDMLLAADRANMPRGREILTIDDFFPEKNWDCLAISAAILDDPYSGMPGIQEVKQNTYRVCVRVADRNGRDQKVFLTFGLQDIKQEETFYPLIDRLCKSGAYQNRTVMTSDVGRILNELRTWSWNSVRERVENGTQKTCVNLDAVEEVVIPAKTRRQILRILRNYRRDYPALAGHVVLEGHLAEEL